MAKKWDSGNASIEVFETALVPRRSARFLRAEWNRPLSVRAADGRGFRPGIAGFNCRSKGLLTQAVA
jgi:hypothetical protein